MSSPQEYTAGLAKLLPPGQVLRAEPGSVLRRLLEAISPALSDAHNRALALIEEADPRSTTELVDEWIRVMGLPDPCTTLPDTLQEQRQAIVQKLTTRGGQSVAFYQAIAAALGYEIEIEEFRPFVAGIGQTGVDLLMGGHDVRFFWRVRVLEPRLTFFRAGSSRAGDLLLSIARAEDLECVLQEHAPTHTQLLFSYEGV